MSPLVASFLRSAALPAVLLSAGILLSKLTPERIRGKLQVLFFALAYVLGSYLLLNRLAFPPHDLSESLSALALLLVTFPFLAPARLGWRYALRALYVAIAGFIILWHLRDSMGTLLNQRNALAFFFLGLGGWSIVERAAGKVAPLTLIALPLVSATNLSFLLLFKGSASLSQLVTTVCALYGALAVLTVTGIQRVAVSALVPFLSIFIIAFMAGGHFYLDINPWHMIFLCLPFFVLWLRDLIPFVPRSPLFEALTLSLLCAGPLAYFMYQIFKTSGPLY